MPIVGWPAKGISAREVKMSIFLSDGLSPSGRWRNTVSDKLNSEAMDCFWVWVRDVDRVDGTRIMARGLPV